VTGTVYLVGAGPGDPKLLTLRGAEVLQQADVVVFDRLIPHALLDLAPHRAELVDAGKEPGGGGMDQEDINRTLIERALAGADVVRLKGGDPFVFGRGGEEALACARAGVAFEIVPGVSAALAAPALAGIPVTHRGSSASFAVVTATVAGGEANNLRAAATAVDTLVVLMAAGRLAAVCAEVIGAGRAPSTPAAIVERAGTGAQRSVVATVGTIAEEAALAQIEAPATLVIGEVVATGAQVLAAMAAGATDGEDEDDVPLDHLTRGPRALRVIPGR
jgi:uroporphyrin-III C-methyltransferase/precorrin-2 dehydrogenase/sirohydrochlorin ferrochelatase